MAALPRLEFHEIDGALKELLHPTIDRLGYFGEFFQYSSHAPEVLKTFMKLSGTLKSELPDDVNEAIALTVCTRMDFPYERIQHERLCEKLGMDRKWIAAMIDRPSDAELSPVQRAVREVSVAMVEGRHVDAREEAAKIASFMGSGVAIAVLFQVTRFMQICTIGRILDMQLPVPSIFVQDGGM